MILYLKDPKNSTQNLLRNKQLHPGGRILNQLIKITSFSIHQ
jgi:hypothetical protein